MAKKNVTQNSALPTAIADVAQLDELLSRPPQEVVDLFGRMQGDLVIVGGGGKIGPSLVNMACRARDMSGVKREIIVIDRYPNAQAIEAAQKTGAKAYAADLLDPEAAKTLPLADNMIYMVGMKFGTTENPGLTWAVNTLIPSHIMARYDKSRVVAFSTGCVYPLVPVKSGGSLESDALVPPGEYCNSCVGRERIFQFYSQARKSKVCIFRLNYAVEMRYGVLVDVAQDIAAGRPVDLAMGYFNVIWQGDVNAAALRMIEHAETPAVAVNVTGPEVVTVRDAASRLGKIMGKPVQFVGKEAETALLSNCTKCEKLIGKPSVGVEQLIEWIGDWVKRGGESLGKPTHFQTRDGKY